MSTELQAEVERLRAGRPARGEAMTWAPCEKCGYGKRSLQSKWCLRCREEARSSPKPKRPKEEKTAQPTTKVEGTMIRNLIVFSIALAASAAQAQQAELCSTYTNIDVNRTIALVKQQVKKDIAEEPTLKLAPIMKCMKGAIETWHREARLFCSYGEDPTEFISNAYLSSLSVCAETQSLPPTYVLPVEPTDEPTPEEPAAR